MGGAANTEAGATAQKAASDRPDFDRYHCQSAEDEAGRGFRPLLGHQPSDRRKEMGDSVNRSAQFSRHAGDARRAYLHRENDG